MPMANAAEFLLQAQNADGGWGYRVRGMSYVEPTAAVLSALRSAPPDARTDTTIVRARDFLLTIQRADGGWGIGSMDTESGWMTAWAVWALVGLADDAMARGVRWLLATEGLRITDPVARASIRTLHRIDSALSGWPWQRGDAAWVHPTALAILALVAAGEREHARVHEGVEYLLDRAVPSGGWNVGNPWMIGKPIPATFQDTAVALLALRAANVTGDPSTGSGQAQWQVARGIEYLHSAVSRAQTAVELAWGIWALAIGDWRLGIRDWRPVLSGAEGLELDDALARLKGLQRADGSWGGNPFITAIAMLASEK